MAFCKGGLAAVRNIVHHIDDDLEIVIEKVTDVTGKIKAIEQNAIVSDLIALIPNGSEIEGWLNTAIDTITGVAQETKTVADKIAAWLNTLATEPAKNAGIFKLASLAVKAADINPSTEKTESFYDSAVQLHVMTNKIS